MELSARLPAGAHQNLESPGILVIGRNTFPFLGDSLMSIKTSLQAVAGVVALAVAGSAFAVTTSDQNGTIFLTINDTKDNTSFIFDTGLSSTGFNASAPTTTQTFNLAGDANYQAFEASVTDQSFVEYSVLGGFGDGSTTNPKIGTLFTASSPASVTTAGGNVKQVYNNLATVLAVGNPSGGSTFVPAATSGTFGWAAAGYEASTNAQYVMNDAAQTGNSMAFYSFASNNPNSGSIPAIQKTFAGVWTLAANGVLTYSVSSVPLPAPLLLLLSGLGLMGVISRRGRSGDQLPGALA
jgi:hypothetical protein